MTNTQDKHSLEQLRRWAAAIEKEIGKIRGDIAPLEQQLAAARERLDLIQRLIKLTEGAQSTAKRAPASHAEASTSGTSIVVPGKQDLESHIENILSEAGKPLHISAIRKALVDRAIPLPGRGDEANIIIRLRRAPERFTRTGRGTYALAALGLDAVPPSKRKRTIRARRSA